MFNAWAAVSPGLSSGGLLDKRITELGSTVPVEPVVVVVTLFVAPKSGFGRRLFPVIGACDSPYPPRTTKLFLPNNCGLQANPKRGSKSKRSIGTRYFELPPRPA